MNYFTFIGNREEKNLEAKICGKQNDMNLTLTVQKDTNQVIWNCDESVEKLLDEFEFESVC